MKQFLIVFSAFLIMTTGFRSPYLRAEETNQEISQSSDVFVDYQNYNHGYCPTCNCYPCKCGAAGCSTCPGTAPAPACSYQAPCEDPACAPPCADPTPTCAPAPACAPQQPVCAPPCAPQQPACVPACATATPCAPKAPCPTAPVCGAECGISVCALAIAIAALATAAVIIVSSGNGSSSH